MVIPASGPAMVGLSGLELCSESQATIMGAAASKTTVLSVRLQVWAMSHFPRVGASTPCSGTPALAGAAIGLQL